MSDEEKKETNEGEEDIGEIEELDSLNTPRPPTCEHGVEAIMGDDEVWRPPYEGPCPECTFQWDQEQAAAAEASVKADEEMELYMSSHSAIASVHVKSPQPASGIPMSLVDVSDVTVDPMAWDEVREFVLNDTAQLGVEDMMDGTFLRLQKLASLSPAAIFERIAISERLPMEERSAVFAELVILTSHITHLANLKNIAEQSRTPFATYRGEPRWMNPSLIIVGATGIGKGNSLVKLVRILGTEAVPRIGHVGRVTIQGLLGSGRKEVVTYKGESEIQEHEIPGFLSKLEDGIALSDELVSILPKKEREDDAVDLASLMELLWRGETHIAQVNTERTVKSWTIFIGAVQPDNWNNELASSLGLFRRAWVHRMPDMDAATAAKKVRDAPANTVRDFGAYAVLRAKFRALQKALDQVVELDSSAVRGWLADEIEAGVLPVGEEAIYTAYAIGDCFLNLPNYHSLTGKVVVDFSEMTIQKRLEDAVAMRREFVRVPSRLIREEQVHGFVIGRTVNGEIYVLKHLISDAVAAFGSDPGLMEEAIRELIYRPPRVDGLDDESREAILNEAHIRYPLVTVDPKTAYEWCEKRMLPLPPEPNEMTSRLLYLGHEAILRKMGFKFVDLEAQKELSDSLRKSHTPAWKREGM